MGILIWRAPANLLAGSPALPPCIHQLSTVMAMNNSMNAVVYRGNRTISIEQCPLPRIQHPKDIIVKVMYAALCGRLVTISVQRRIHKVTIAKLSFSDLHVFRGFEESKPGTIMGHEFCGTVVERGSEVKNLILGASVVSPFTTSW